VFFASLNTRLDSSDMHSRGSYQDTFAHIHPPRTGVTCKPPNYEDAKTGGDCVCAGTPGCGLGTKAPCRNRTLQLRTSAAFLVTTPTVLSLKCRIVSSCRVWARQLKHTKPRSRDMTPDTVHDTLMSQEYEVETKESRLRCRAFAMG